MKPVLFVHHSSDTDFAERLSEDLHAMSIGVRCLAAETEGDPPVRFFDSREVFAHVFVLSAAFEQTTWFEWLDHLTEKQAQHLVLSVQVETSKIPRLLLDKACVDVSAGRSRPHSLDQLIDLLRTPRNGPLHPREVPDLAHLEHGSIPHHYARPLRWHCVFCGWGCEDPGNDSSCGRCEKIRPFAGGTTTMKCCSGCQGWSLAVALYCEWCGVEM